jgi:hypothetical protein
MVPASSCAQHCQAVFERVARISGPTAQRYDCKLGARFQGQTLLADGRAPARSKRRRWSTIIGTWTIHWCFLAVDTAACKDAYVASINPSPKAYKRHAQAQHSCRRIALGFAAIANPTRPQGLTAISSDRCAPAACELRGEAPRGSRRATGRQGPVDSSCVARIGDAARAARMVLRADRERVKSTPPKLCGAGGQATGRALQ